MKRCLALLAVAAGMAVAGLAFAEDCPGCVACECDDSCAGGDPVFVTGDKRDRAGLEAARAKEHTRRTESEPRTRE
jgi:hypothetical protein